LDVQNIGEDVLKVCQGVEYMKKGYGRFKSIENQDNREL
jgi:hypothetical protein